MIVTPSLKATECEAYRATNRDRMGGGTTRGRMTAKLSRPKSQGKTPCRQDDAEREVSGGRSSGGLRSRWAAQREGPNSEESASTVRYDKAKHQTSNEQFELPLEERGEAPTAEWRGEAMSAGQKTSTEDSTRRGA
jgi:hypothetical protein